MAPANKETPPKDWFADPDFWRLTAPVMFAPGKWTAAPVEIDHLLQLVKAEPSLDVLDLPCGQGRHSLALARRGHRVTAMDLNQDFIGQARSKGEEEGLSINWQLGDMRHLEVENRYNLMVNLFSSFGYFRDDREEMQTLQNFFRALQPGGTLVMDLMAKEVLARQFLPRVWDQAGDTRLLMEHEINDHWRRVINRWTVITPNLERTFEFSMRLYDAGGLVDLLAQAGFTDMETLGHLDGRPYDQYATRLVVKAKKP